jgi:hypothetical protein
VVESEVRKLRRDQLKRALPQAVCPDRHSKLFVAMLTVIARLLLVEEPRRRMTEYREAFAVSAMSASDAAIALGYG